MPPEDLSAWERVGPLLAARRAAVDPRYANRRLFAKERGMNWRTLHDAERAKRANFRPEMITAFESAYMLVPGSLARSLAGGDLEPAPRPDLPPLAAVPDPGPPFSPSTADDSLIEAFINAFPDPVKREQLRGIWEYPAPRDLRVSALEGNLKRGDPRAGESDKRQGNSA
jgi:hypothetical protein